MNPKIGQLREQIAALQVELIEVVREQEHSVLFRVHGRRVEFEQSVRQAHAQLKTNFFRWLVTNRPQNLLTGPIIYSMIVPLVLLDLCVSIYQALCFPVYRVAKARRSDYIVFDRHKLEYLNFLEKFHCTYCAYGNGVLAFASEIAARTEEYFCPIKHAQKALGCHLNHERFLEYGDAQDYASKLERIRNGLAEGPNQDPH